MKHCPICQNTEFTPFLKTKDYFYSQETFEIINCTSCGFKITHPIPSAENIGHYYNSDNYVSHNASAKGLINRIYKSAQRFNFRMKFSAIKKHVPRGTWMDYGAGNGAFVQYLKSKKIPVVGYEPSKEARNTSPENLLDIHAYSKDETLYSCITMWHVLEHVPNINDIIAQHYNHLCKDGVLVIAVPNIDSYDSEYYKHKWAALDTPRHLWHFNESNLKKLLAKHSLQHIQTTGMHLDSFYVSMLSEKYKRGFAPKAILIGLLSNLMAVFRKKPFSSQIYVFRKISN